MAIILNDNLRINAGKPADSKYLNASNAPYSATTEVLSAIGLSERHQGLTVLVESGSTNVEHWFKNGTADGDLIEKKFASEQLVGDFITGATNLGYFSGTTGVQVLQITSANSAYNGNYWSIYNYYYRDNSGVIRIGKADYDEPFRRAYVATILTLDKSWVWDVSSGGWRFIDGDVRDLVSQAATLGVDYGPTYYTLDEWVAGFYNSGTSASVNVTGDLTTGNTITIGNPIYRDKSNQELHLRTIINDTPQFLKIDSDDYYIRFSGVSSVITASNIGTGEDVFSGKSGVDLRFRTLVGSGNTVITPSSSGEELIIFTSISGATNITGGTNIGYSGATPVYAGINNADLEFRPIIGSGDTTVSLSGDTIVVYSDSSGLVFTDDILVSLSGGKTFGKYEDGDTIPASGKTAAEVIQLATFEAIDPSATLSSSGNNVAFGESGKTVNLNFGYTINTPGASVSGVTLEWRRGGTGAWTGLTITTGDTTYNHSVDDSANRFNTAVINFRYTVVDSVGGSVTVTHNVTPQGYAAPSMSLTLNGTLDGIDETQNSRDKGNVTGGISSGSINSNRSLVDITDWTFERRYDGGSWTVLASGSSLSTQSVSIPSTPDNSIPTTATSIDYRITYTDEWTSGNGGAQSISFFYYSYYGFSTNTTLNSTQIQNLTNKDKRSGRSLTWSNINSPTLEYTYYSYPASYGAITSIILNGVTPILGAFNELSQVSVTNTYGESLNYRVYKSVAPGAFGATDSVAFS